MALSLSLSPSDSDSERKNENPNSCSPRETGLDDLGNDELFQVLVRVPQRTARIIRAVARRWNAIICSPDYAALLCSNHPKSDDHTLLLTCRGYENLLMLPPSEEKSAAAPLEECHIDLSYVADGCDYRCICSTSDDLVLISFRKHLFVCNPFTKENVRLPISPSSFSFLVKKSVRLPPSPSYLSSIVCEEETTCAADRNNKRRRYRVVHYSLCLFGLCFRSVFVSETGTWNDITSSGPPWIWEFAHQSVNSAWKKVIYPVAYGGKLHWFNGQDCVVYDPFEDFFTVIPGPQLEEEQMVADDFGYWLGNVHGSLTLAKYNFECGSPVDLCYIFIWELDCERGLWRLRNKSWFQKPDKIQDMEIGALHPTQDIVYFVMSNDIGLHDLSKGNDNFSKVLLPGDASYDFFMLKSFLLARSWHPTSVCYHGSDCVCLPPLDEFPMSSFDGIDEDGFRVIFSATSPTFFYNPRI